MEPALLQEKKTYSKGKQRPFRLKASQLRSFLTSMQANGRTESTIKKYRNDLNRFYDFLGEDKWVYAHSLPQWKESMIAQGYAERTINSSVVAVNNLYDYLGCWEWQCFEWMKLKKTEGPELTREEYLLLLKEARRQENSQLYLLIKVMATTDLTPGDMPLLTRETVNQGWVTGKTRGTKQERIFLPAQLQEDLLDYAMHHGIKSGPLFLNASQKCMERTNMTRLIAQLGEDIGLSPGKANPRNLRKMYLSTMEEYRLRAEAWVASSYVQLLGQEENSIGWRVRQK